LEIMQTPVLEAFTNDDSSMKSKLVTYSRTDLLYLPVIIPNEAESTYKRHSSGTWIVAVDQNTVGTQTTPGLVVSTDSEAPTGILNGFSPGAVGAASVRTDQGIDNSAIPHGDTLESGLVETQYLVLMDNRFGSIVDTQGNSQTKSFVDDDNIATYLFTQGSNNTGGTLVGDLGTGDVPTPLRGARGTFFNFSILASTNLQTSNFLFDEVGSTGLSVAGATTLTCRFIDTNITIMGLTTGYKVDIPVRYVKKQ
jgi:hypothetical protein